MSSRYQYERGNFDTAESDYNIALAIYEQHPEQTVEDIADVLVSLSALSNELNDPQKHLGYAERHYEMRMKLRAMKDVPHIQLGMAYTQRASAYTQTGQYEKAIEQARMGRSVLETYPGYLKGEYWPFYAMIYEVLPLMSLGRDAEAARLLQDTVAWREKKYGVNDTQSFHLGFALHMLANIRERHGRHGESAELYEKALANYRATMGTNYHRVATVCTKLARHYIRHEKYETASVFYDQAEKSQLLELMGEHEEAKQVLDKSRSYYRDLIPVDDDVSVEKELTADDFDSLVLPWSR
ncbi:hypothetical protein QQX98_002824 [Neonectria punicea]|uniref:MalT-like TPR region domain-containing protein n=1 Tax=Neonectria punicea TaxID=979145 RepID=A0ABR1HH34_9HYPO